MPQPTDVESWMVSYLADLLEIPQSEVGLTDSFETFGLDSVAIVSMTSDLSKWVGFELKSDLLFQYPDIRSLADHLGQTKALGAD